MHFTMNSALLAAILVTKVIARHRDKHTIFTTASIPPNSTEQANAWQIHNELRDTVGVPPIIWSDEFAEMAQATADHLAARNDNLTSYQNRTVYAEQLMYFETAIDGRGDLVTAADLWALDKLSYNEEVIPRGDFDQYYVYS